MIPTCRQRATGIAIFLATTTAPLLAQTLQLHPHNPRWFLYGSQHVALSGNGIWQLIPDTDIPITQHNTFAANHGANTNRITLFSFCHQEELCPWQRTGPGTANDGKPKYNLDKPNKVYWQRVVTYFEDCKKRAIFPLVQIWGECYVEGAPVGEQRWLQNPFNPDNNVNNLTNLPRGLADAGRDDAFYNTDNPKLITYQNHFVTQALDKLAHFPVIWDIGNEIGLDTKISDRWLQHWTDFFDAYEASHPGITILATVDTNVDRGHYDRIKNLDVVNIHGARAARPFTRQGKPDKDPNDSRVDVKQMQIKLNKLYKKYKKPLINSRLASDPDRKRPLRDRPGNALETRHILWGYFFSAAHFISFRNELSTSWTQQPQTTERQQRALRKFMGRIEFWKCVPRPTTIVTTGDAVVLAETNRQYAFYTPNGNHFADRFVADLSEANNATFDAQWFNPRTGQIAGPAFKVVTGPAVEFKLPTDEDWALYLRRTGE